MTWLHGPATSIRRARVSLPAALLCGLLVATLPMVGCASADNDASGDNTATSTDRGAPAGRDRTGEAGTAADESAAGRTDQGETSRTRAQTQTRAGASGQKLGDAEILAILEAANEGEVAAGQLAVQKASSADVREFAQDMVQDHSQAKQKVEQTAAGKAATGGSTAAAELDQQVDSEIKSLSAQSGAQFDRAYIEGQVKMHQHLLEKLQTELIPSAQSPEVRQLLETTRAKVSEHLQNAQQLQQQLASAAG